MQTNKEKQYLNIKDNYEQNKGHFSSIPSPKMQATVKVNEIQVLPSFKSDTYNNYNDNNNSDSSAENNNINENDGHDSSIHKTHIQLQTAQEVRQQIGNSLMKQGSMKNITQLQDDTIINNNMSEHLLMNNTLDNNTYNLSDFHQQNKIQETPKISHQNTLNNIYEEYSIMEGISSQKSQNLMNKFNSNEDLNNISNQQLHQHSNSNIYQKLKQHQTSNTNTLNTEQGLKSNYPRLSSPIRQFSQKASYFDYSNNPHSIIQQQLKRNKRDSVQGKLFQFQNQNSDKSLQQKQQQPFQIRNINFCSNQQVYQRRSSMNPEIYSQQLLEALFPEKCGTSSSKDLQDLDKKQDYYQYLKMLQIKAYVRNFMKGLVLKTPVKRVSELNNQVISTIQDLAFSNVSNSKQQKSRYNKSRFSYHRNNVNGNSVSANNNSQDQHSLNIGQIGKYTIAQSRNFIRKMQQKIVKLHIFPKLFDPNSTPYFFWDLLHILVSSIIWFIQPIEVITRKKLGIQIFGDYWMAIKITSLVIFLVDIILQFNTRRYVKGAEQTNRKLIAKVYLKGHFILDIICFGILFNSIVQEELYINQFYILIKMKLIFQLISKVMNKYIANKQVHYCLELMHLFITSIAFCHILSILWWGLAEYQIQEGEITNWVTVYEFDRNQWHIIYLYSFYFNCMTMTTVGYGDYSPKSPIETIFVITSMIISTAVFAYILTKIGEIIIDINRDVEAFKKEMNLMIRYMSKKNIDEELRQEAINYINYKFKSEKNLSIEEENMVVDNLSEHLKNKLILNANIQIVRKCKLFDKYTEETKEAISMQLQLMTLQENSLIYEEGEKEDDFKFYFIDSGSVVKFEESCKGDISSTSFQKLSKSSCFGEQSFMTNQVRMSGARSLEITTLYYLSRSDFLEIIQANKRDYQLFCLQRDKMLFKIRGSNKSACLICGIQNHIIHSCPYIHFIPDRQRVVLQEVYSVEQKREKQKNERKLNQKFSTLMQQSQVKDQWEVFKYKNFSEDSDEDDDDYDSSGLDGESQYEEDQYDQKHMDSVIQESDNDSDSSSYLQSNSMSIQDSIQIQNKQQIQNYQQQQGSQKKDNYFAIQELGETNQSQEMTPRVQKNSRKLTPLINAQQQQLTPILTHQLPPQLQSVISTHRTIENEPQHNKPLQHHKKHHKNGMKQSQSKDGQSTSFRKSDNALLKIKSDQNLLGGRNYLNINFMNGSKKSKQPMVRSRKRSSTNLQQPDLVNQIAAQYNNMLKKKGSFNIGSKKQQQEEIYISKGKTPKRKDNKSSLDRSLMNNPFISQDNLLEKQPRKKLSRFNSGIQNQQLQLPTVKMNDSNTLGGMKASDPKSPRLEKQVANKNLAQVYQLQVLDANNNKQQTQQYVLQESQDMDLNHHDISQNNTHISGGQQENEKRTLRYQRKKMVLGNHLRPLEITEYEVLMDGILQIFQTIDEQPENFRFYYPSDNPVWKTIADNYNRFRGIGVKFPKDFGVYTFYNWRRTGNLGGSNQQKNQQQYQKKGKRGYSHYFQAKDFPLNNLANKERTMSNMFKRNRKGTHSSPLRNKSPTMKLKLHTNQSEDF